MQWGPIIMGWVIAAPLLLIEHILLWERPRRMRRPGSYILGTLTLGCGWIAWGVAATGPLTPIDAVANIGAVSCSGAVVLLAYAWRASHAQAQRTKDYRAIALALTQEIVDQGGRHDAGQSDLSDRRN